MNTKPQIKSTAVYANIGWRVTESGEQSITSRAYMSLKEQEDDRIEMEREGWSVCASMGLFWAILANGVTRAANH